MSNCIIKFGQINTKFLLPIFLAVLQVVFIIINRYYEEKHNNLVFQLFAHSIGEMLIKVLPCILKISFKNLNEKQGAEETKQNKFKHYSLLCLLFIGNSSITAGAILAKYYLVDRALGKGLDYKESNLFPEKDFIIMSIEMIVMIFVSICLLKYKYYKHHIISVIIFMIFGILSEILIGFYSFDNKLEYLFKFIRVLGCAVDATNYCYQKYLMDKYYYPYWNIAFVPGVVMLLLSTIVLIIALSNPLKENSPIPLVKEFYLYFTQETGRTVGRIILVFVLHVIMCPLTILTIYYFSPNFILIVIQFSRITQHLIKMKEVGKFFLIAFYIIQIVALMIHLEIIELNFCGLNEFTKRNINLRGVTELLDDDRDSTAGVNIVDINKDYKINMTEKQENVVEMEEQEQVDEKND